MQMSWLHGLLDVLSSSLPGNIMFQLPIGGERHGSTGLSFWAFSDYFESSQACQRLPGFGAGGSHHANRHCRVRFHLSSRRSSIGRGLIRDTKRVGFHATPRYIGASIRSELKVCGRRHRRLMHCPPNMIEVRIDKQWPLVACHESFELRSWAIICGTWRTPTCLPCSSCHHERCEILSCETVRCAPQYDAHSEVVSSQLTTL